MRGKFLLLFLSIAFSFLLTEGTLRIFVPHLGLDLFLTSSPKDSPFLYDEQIGYEVKPFARLDTVDDKSRPILELINSDGFRGEERIVPKPKGVYRILAIGDSVVQGMPVSYRHSWPKVLEDLLNREAKRSQTPTRYEVINAGVGGYVSWQALERLKGRGSKYQPDLVLVLVGWNNMLYSSLRYWKPTVNLADIKQAYLQRPVNGNKGWWAASRAFLYRISYLARFVRQVRNYVWNWRRNQELIRTHQRDSGVAINPEALRRYGEDLEQIYQTAAVQGARMALILWPTILTPELLSDRDIHKKLLLHYSTFEFSTQELWNWYIIYIDAQQKFALRHPDIILIDAAKAFEDESKKDRLNLFSDLSHLTIHGNRLLAEVILAHLMQEKSVL